MPFKTYNFRNDLSLIIILSTGICYSEKTLALTLIFALKIKKKVRTGTQGWGDGSEVKVLAVQEPK